jgi:hypothetical protein
MFWLGRGPSSGGVRPGWVTAGAVVDGDPPVESGDPLPVTGSGATIGLAAGFALPGAVVAAIKLKTTVRAVAPTPA